MRRKVWHGFYGSCYRYETDEPEDEWHEWREFRKHSLKMAVYVWILRKSGIKQGLCSYIPGKWFERPLRILFFPWESVKRQCYWWFKSNV